MHFCESCHRDYPDSISVCPKCGETLRTVVPLIDRKQILADLKRLPGYFQILENCTLTDDSRTIHFDYIMIHEAGIFAFRLVESYRLLEGTDKKRFWTAAERGKEDHPFSVERPVLLLEKDQNILEQILRKYFFTKTFAFLLFPEDGGLENVRTNHRDQFLTERTLYSVVLHMIDAYGYVYNQVGVDKMTELIALLVKNSAEDPQTAGGKHAGRRKGKRAGRVFALLVILAAAGLAYLFSRGMLDPTALPSFAPYVEDIKDRLGLDHDLSIPSVEDIKDRLGADHDLPIPSLPAPSASAQQLTIPADYGKLFQPYTDDALHTQGRKVGFTAVERGADGTLLLRFANDRKTEILAEADRAFHGRIDTRSALGQLSDITSVRTDDHEEFVLFVVSQSLDDREENIVRECARYGILCAYLEDRLPESFSITIRNQSGQKLSTYTIKDFI